MWQRSVSWIPAFRPAPKKVTIQVCCPECAARVQSDPAGTLASVIADRGRGLR